jgi:hypothetical protein
MRENSATYTSASDINGTLDTAFRQRSHRDLGDLMTRLGPADLTIHELIGVIALLQAADQRREAPVPERSAQVLSLVPSNGESE